MSKYATLVADPIPQSEPLTKDQVKNNAGGFVFQISDWDRLDRFLILGSDANTYYQSAKKLTREKAACVQRCLDTDPVKTLAAIIDTSVSGRAPKNNAAIFALAIATTHKDVKVRSMALTSLADVCRTSTHLFQFLSVAKALGKGWGRALKRAVADWYDKKDPGKLAYQFIKYRNREGYTHKRVLQLAHPKGDGTGRNIDIASNKLAERPRVYAGAQSLMEASVRDNLYRWVCEKPYELATLPAIVQAHLEAMSEPEAQAVVKLVKKYRLPWEAIPTSLTKDPAIWQAMLPDMGLTALIRNLGGMTQYEALKPLSKEVSLVIDRLNSEEELRKARIHPFNVLTALKVYSEGKAFRGSREWEPIARIIQALDDAFYKSFKFVEPTGKRILIGLDVSGSMSYPLVDSPLMVSEGAAALAMTTMRTENNWHIFAFAGDYHRKAVLQRLDITARDSLPQIMDKTSRLTFGRTDCSLPMLYATDNELKVDAFQIITDNETWHGKIHPAEALNRYRKASGINAKLVVVGMTSTGFSMADPNDPGMLDVVGFDSSAPAVMADFIRK